MAIKIEKNGEAVYRNAVDKVSNHELVSLLEWMADEEAKHADWFSKLKLGLKEKHTNPFVEEMSRELFDELLGKKNFSLKDVDFSTVDEIDDMLAVFIDFEKDSVIFYEILEPFIEDPVTLENLKIIIKEEHNHIKKIQEFAGRENMFTTIRGLK
jgi:rubrerythrin